MHNPNLLYIKRSPFTKKTHLLGWMLLFAMFSLFTTLTLPYVGEEAVYTITSLELAQKKEWLNPTIYHADYGRPPLMNWLIIPLAKYLGWDKVLIASRLVTAVATLATTWVLMLFSYFLMQRNLLLSMLIPIFVHF